MKAVILAGGLGTRMREETEFRPKPMVEVGGKPVLWHIMKIFAQQGITDFVILTGYKGEIIKRYFLEYAMMNLDFRVEIGSDSKSAIEYFGSHEEAGWTVTVLDTGELTLTGERILLAKEHIGTDPFFITYGDGIANVNLKELLAVHSRTGASLTISTAKPRSRFGVVAMSSQSDMVERFLEKPEGTELVNIGYMVASFSLFDYLEPGVALEDAPIARLAENGLLAACNHSGYWQAMDTIRELQILNKDWNHGSPAWATPL